jgi:procollagen-lysine,2-oxoglutarate 5-dioxygenase
MNLFGPISDKGFYARSTDYMSIVKNEIRSVWNVPYITSVYLMKSNVLNKISYSQKDLDPDMAFCQHLRNQNIFLYATNYNFYGHLINAEHFDVKRTRPDFYELFTNRIDWEERFLHEDYMKSLEPDNVPKQPCPDVYVSCFCVWFL